MAKANLAAKDFAGNPRIMAEIEKQIRPNASKRTNIKREIQKSTEEVRSYMFLNALQKYNIAPKWRYVKDSKTNEIVEREILFARKDFDKGWRCDYYFEENGIKLAIEQEGGTQNNGRHTRGNGYEEDMKKYNCYTALGIRLLRFTTKEMSFFPNEIAEIVMLALNDCNYSVKMKQLYKF